jgi:hypothetical protein
MKEKEISVLKITTARKKMNSRLPRPKRKRKLMIKKKSS